MATVKLEIEHIGNAFSAIASASLEQCNPSAVLSRLARVFAQQGEPTLAVILERLSAAMLAAEERGETIALCRDHFAYIASIDYANAKTLAEKDF